MYILLVDDSEPMGLYLKDLVAQASIQHKILIANSTANAMQMALSHKDQLHAILADQVLDKGTGLELMENLRQLGVVPQIRILITQGGKLNSSEQQYASANQIHVLAKPTPQTESALIADLKRILI